MIRVSNKVNKNPPNIIVSMTNDILKNTTNLTKNKMLKNSRLFVSKQTATDKLKIWTQKFLSHSPSHFWYETIHLDDKRPAFYFA